MPDLREIVSNSDGAYDGQDLTKSGIACAHLARVLQDDRRASAIIAANFWKAYVESSSFIAEALPALGINLAIVSRSDKIIVCRENIHRYDLLLFAPIAISTKSFHVKVKPDDIFEAWNRWRQNFSTLDPLLWNHGLALEPALMGPPFSVTVTASPFTRAMCVPDPPLQVSTSIQNSTAGVIASRRGRHGVTLALHAVGTASHVQIGNVNVTAPILASHLVTDSCFAEVSPLSAGVKAPNGILKNILPRGNQPAEFGRSSDGSWQGTIITAWSLDLPQISVSRQDRIYTTDHVRPGDSGTALITSDGYVAGFAFEQADPLGTTNFASWIWAHTVVDALDLTV